MTSRIISLNNLGYPVKIISKVIGISCNERRNSLFKNYIINKFVDTINGFVCIRIAGGHSFYDMVPQFSTVYFVFSQIWNYFFTRCGLCQDTISTYKLSIYVKNM